MPIYSYLCKTCEKLTDVYRTVDNRNNAPNCSCGSTTEKVISAPSMVMGDIAPYRNVIDGKTISGRAQHREFLKRHDMVEVGNEGRPKTGDSTHAD